MSAPEGKEPAVTGMPVSTPAAESALHPESGVRIFLKAYADLLRIHFFFAWPLIFCSGLLLATAAYGSFSWLLVGKGVLIGFFGFEAGLVLNDYIDRDYDRQDIEHRRLTRYWRMFGRRPLPAGHITPEAAFRLFALFFAITTFLIATLPFPNSLYVFAIMVLSYCLEAFYQVKKRRQAFPVAQLAGRVDFALFPAAGYLCAGSPDSTAFLYVVFFYPLVMAHLGVNDLIDIANDRVRGMKTIPVLYGNGGTAAWIAGFTALHILAAALFLPGLGITARAGITAGLVLLVITSAVIIRGRDPDTGMKVLPVFHGVMILYACSIVADAAVRSGLA